jgi:hypothetical protein
MRQGEVIRYETLLRDETVSAQDAVNGKEYVRVLRRAVSRVASIKSYSSAIHRLSRSWRITFFQNIVPSQVYYLESLPLGGASGKIDRRALVRMLEEGKFSEPAKRE